MENNTQMTAEETAPSNLALIIKESGLEQTKAQILLDKFTNYFQIAAEWEAKIKGLNVTNPSQKAEMKMAGEARKFLKAKRIDVEKTRKELKEQSLREGQTIDSIARILKNLIEPLEEKAEEIETFAQRLEAQQKAELQSKRLAELQQYNFQYNTGFDLGSMDETMYQNLLAGTKKAHEDRIEAERKAEEERIAREKAEAEERERIRQENERLKAEAQAREKQMEAERKAAEQERLRVQEEERKKREEIEVKARAEAQARMKAEMELKEKEAAEAKRIAEEKAKREAEEKARKDAERKAKNAPDKVKLIELAKQIESIQMPELKSDEAKAILTDVRTLLSKVSNHIQTKSESL